MPLPLIPIAIGAGVVGAVGALAAIFGSDDDKPRTPPPQKSDSLFWTSWSR